jgi:hypothetical protein
LGNINYASEGSHSNSLNNLKANYRATDKDASYFQDDNR